MATINLCRPYLAPVKAVCRLCADRANRLNGGDDLELKPMIHSDAAPLLLPEAFFHYNACFDAQAIIKRYAVSNLVPNAKYLTNYLGVLIDPKFLPQVLSGCENTIEAMPIPANWHADIAEWGAALRAVDLSRRRFTVMELGCGWGCWLNITGVAARMTGREVYMIGVEGDPHHIQFAREAVATNGFPPEQVELHHGIVAAEAGVALFPNQAVGGTSWGIQPIFDATEEQLAAASREGSHMVLPVISLARLLEPHDRIDLLHIDIQGGEVNVVSGSIKALQGKVAYLLIGTHSRQIEGLLIDLLMKAGWMLEVERPAIISIRPAGHVHLIVDGVQGWRNPHFAQ
jgi:FkbM family methyltransferase